MKPLIRLATEADGPAIGKLFAAADYGDLGVDWHAANVANGWLVADRDGEIVGALQVFAGQPYGFLGMCVVLPSARARDLDGRGRPARLGEIARTLIGMALNLLDATGTQVASVVTTQPGMKRIVTRYYGGMSLGSMDMFAGPPGRRTS